MSGGSITGSGRRQGDGGMLPEWKLPDSGQPVRRPNDRVVIASPSFRDDRELSFGTMSEHPHLVNAPIREALIDFRVRLASDFSPETLLGLTEELYTEYPKVGPIHQFQGAIQLSNEGPVSVQRPPQLLGYRLESADTLNIAQIRIDGFTFSRLEPYESWERMVEDGWIVWRKYLEIASPLGVERIATRFINRIILPPSGQLAEVLSVPPVVPDGRIDSLLFRYQLVPTNGVTAIVSLATEDGPDPSMILDIDCFVRKSLPTDEDVLRRQLRMVRDAKNRIFFSCLATEAIERFK